ncbi:MAG: nuclear transport factor 2 family protein [Vicingaceae bacterium]
MKLITLLITVFISCSLFSQDSELEKVVQANLDAYNNRDIETFMKYIDDDIAFYNLGECEPYLKGKEEVRKRYQDYFDKSPNLHSEIKNRMVFGNKVIDYEYITGSNGTNEPFELIFMYEVEDQKIVKTTAIRKP